MIGDAAADNRKLTRYFLREEFAPFARRFRGVSRLGTGSEAKAFFFGKVSRETATLTGFEPNFDISLIRAITAQTCSSQGVNSAFSNTPVCTNRAELRSFTVRNCPKNEVTPRRDHPGVDTLPFGRLWYDRPNAVSNAIDYAKHRSRFHHCAMKLCLVGLLPVACDPHPASGSALPVARHPHCGLPRRQDPTPGYPHIASPGPTPVTGCPDISRSWRDGLGLNANRRRSLSH